MGKYNILTGNVITEHDEHPIIKPMCLNCTSCLEEDDVYRCNNPKVMESGFLKVSESLPEGFEIDTLVLKPMLLKNPTKKCPNYKTDEEMVIGEVMGYLNP